MTVALDNVRRAWVYFDPKFKYQLLSALVAYVVFKVGIPLDPKLEGLLAIVIGGVTGFSVDNGTSRVRRALKSSGRPRSGRVVKKRRRMSEPDRSR